MGAWRAEYIPKVALFLGSDELQLVTGIELFADGAAQSDYCDLVMARLFWSLQPAKRGLPHVLVIENSHLTRGVLLFPFTPADLCRF